MRALALAALLLSPALAHAQTIADLADEVLEATAWDLVEASFMSGLLAQGGGGFPGAEEAFDLDLVRASVRETLVADSRRELLEAILVHLRSPENAAAVERGRRNVEDMRAPGGLDRLVAQIQDPNPKKGTLADEALARRYVEAQGLGEVMPRMMRRMFGGLAEAIPELQAELDATPGGLDALVAQFDAETLAQIEDANTRGTQIGYAGLPESVLREAVAFAESPAGRYYNATVAEAMIDVVIPRIVDAMATAYRQSATSSPASGASDDYAIGISNTPPPPPAADGAEIYEVVEVQPTLIGGLEGLQQRVVYPEAARRAGIEGQVVIQFVVDPEGRVIDPVVLRSPNDLLSEAALAAVRDSKFTPGTQRGEPVHVRFAVPITFRLSDPSPDEVAEDIARYLDAPLRPPALESEEVFELADTPPELIGGLGSLESRLVYPEAARRDGIEGVVVIRLVVTEQGEVEDAVVIESPDNRLNEAALDAIRASRFTPGLRQERPVRSPVAIPVLFRLGGG